MAVLQVTAVRPRCVCCLAHVVEHEAMWSGQGQGPSGKGEWNLAGCSPDFRPRLSDRGSESR